MQYQVISVELYILMGENFGSVRQNTKGIPKSDTSGNY